MGDTVFLAHINEENERQTLKVHLQTTSMLCGQFADKIDCKNIGLLCGLLHDIGKYTTRFNTYLQNAHNGIFGQKHNHSSAGGVLLFSLMEKDTDGFSLLLKQLVSEAICCHHSGLCDNLTPNGEDGFLKRVSEKQDILYDEVYQNFCDEFSIEEDVLPLISLAKNELIAIVKKINLAEIDTVFSFGLLQKYLFSCLTDADRLDTACFMLGEKLPSTSNNQVLFEKLAENLENQLNALQAKPKGTESVDKLNAIRCEISQMCKAAAKKAPAIYTLPCPTGAGKTLSSIRFALNHCVEYGKEKIFYVIPFCTIIDQNADVLKKFLSANENDTTAKNAIAEIHSSVVPEDNEDVAEKNSFSLLAERFEKPITLTTMVHFLDIFFSHKTQSTRAIHQFSNSVVIFDEIQALPLNCIYLFNSLVNFLVYICGATVILCTATQPCLDKVKHSIKVQNDFKLVDIDDKTKAVFKRVDIVPCDTSQKITVHETARLIFEKAKTENNVLGIFNTKTSAKAVFTEINDLNKESPKNEQYEVYLLTTLFCPSNRRELLAQIIKKLKVPNSKIICITTQLIEAGVDISFNAVFRAAAGLDSIVQAAGRCNRNKSDTLKKVYVLNPDFENLAHLQDIQNAKDKTFRLFDDYKIDPIHFKNDLLSDEAIDTYYKYFFAQNESQMGYFLKEYKKYIYDLLSQNASANEAYRSICGSEYQLPLRQSFKTASQNFKAIDSLTTSVLVPFSHGKEIITALAKKDSLKNKVTALKQAQQYSVNLFDYEIKALGNAVYPLGDTGIYAISESYYNEKNGVSFTNLSDEALIF